MTDPDPTGSAAGIPAPPAQRAVATGAARRPDPRKPRWTWLWIAVGVVFLSVVIVVSLVSGGDDDENPLESLTVGACIESPPAGDARDMHVVACSEPHQTEVYALGDVSEPLSDAELTAEASGAPGPVVSRICRDDVPAAIIEKIADIDANSHAYGSFLVGESRQGRLVCTINTEPRTGSFVQAAGQS